MPNRNAIFPENRHALYEAHGYSAAVRSGDHLFVSGQVGSLPDGSPEPDFAKQVELAFQNLEAVLAAAGASFDDIIDVTTFPTTTRYRSQQVGDVDVFYREAGPADAPVILLLHGFPTASHMFRDLIPLLADRYRLVAPDLPGFGQTKAPARGTFDYTFDRLARVIEGFTEALSLNRYALYIFDYGAPVGLRLAMRHPDRVSAIISQNGNAYTDGFSDQWGPWEAYWRDGSEANREACRPSLSPNTIRNWQYGTGADPERLSPDGHELDIAYMARPDAEEIQLDLIRDYRTNVALYPDFQAYFRAHRPPLMATWGRHDPAFIPAGAKAYKRDLPDAEVHLLDAGHFALETHAGEIAALIREFLGRVLSMGDRGTDALSVSGS